jgi:hypothetical protein
MVTIASVCTVVGVIADQVAVGAVAGRMLQAGRLTTDYFDLNQVLHFYWHHDGVGFDVHIGS